MTRSDSARRTLLLVLLLAAPAPEVRAQEDGEPRRRQASELYRRGSALFSAGDFPAALQLLRQAQELYPSHKIELSMGYTLEELGRLPEAAEIYARFLASPAGSADRIRAGEVQGKLARLRLSLARISLTCQERGAGVELDGRYVGRTPLAHELYVSPGRHRLVVTLKGQLLHRQTLVLRRGEHHWTLVEASSGRTEGERAVPPRPAPVYKRWWFWAALGGVAVTAAVVGVVVPNVGGSDRVPGQDLGIVDMR